jgi:MYXO-CTERM domain-containing protein
VTPRPFLVCALVATAIAAARPASAYCRTTTDEKFQPTLAQPCAPDGAPLYWPFAAIDFFVNAQASVQVTVEQTRAASETAFDSWTHADCPLDLATCGGTGGGPPSIAVRYAGTTEVHAAEYRRDGTDQNVILYWDAVWPYPDDGSTLALTTVTFGAESGQIVDADIEVNSNPKVTPLTVDDPRGRAVYDLPSILQHETGHVLGLAHTQPGHSDATMYTYYQKGSWDMRTLAGDDVCGICNVYPPTHLEGGGCALSAPGTPAPGARRTPVPALLAAMLGLAAIGAIRKRRRHSQ